MINDVHEALKMTCCVASSMSRLLTELPSTSAITETCSQRTNNKGCIG